MASFSFSTQRLLPTGCWNHHEPHESLYKDRGRNKVQPWDKKHVSTPTCKTKPIEEGSPVSLYHFIWWIFCERYIRRALWEPLPQRL